MIRAVVIALALGLGLGLASGCHHEAKPKRTGTGTSGVQRGFASWYGEPQMTASGERFDRYALTAAHRSLPLGTRVRVTNQRNGRAVTVRINDRGPYSGGRIIDLSEAAAKVLHMIEAGIVPVTIEVIRP